MISMNLSDNYKIKACSTDNCYEVAVYYTQNEEARKISLARLLTDNVDLGCITDMMIDDFHAKHFFSRRAIPLPCTYLKNTIML